MLSFEEYTYFPVLHLIMPFFLYSYYRNGWKVCALVYIWESFEVLLYTIFDSYPIFTSIVPGQEPITNSLLLDPIQGIIGLLWGRYLFTTYPFAPIHTLPTRYFYVLALIYIGSSSIIQWAPGFDAGYMLFIVIVFGVYYVLRTIVTDQLAFRWYLFHVFILVFIPLFPITSSVVYRTWIGCIISMCFEYGVQRNMKTKQKIKVNPIDDEDKLIIPFKT